MSVLHSFGVEIVISGWWLVAHSLSGGLGGFHVAWLAPFTRWATCLTTKHWTVGVTHMTCTPHLHCMPSHLGLLHSWTRLPAWPWNIELMLHTSPAFCVYMSSYFGLLHSVIHTQDHQASSPWNNEQMMFQTSLGLYIKFTKWLELPKSLHQWHSVTPWKCTFPYTKDCLPLPLHISNMILFFHLYKLLRSLSVFHFS